MPNVYNVGKKKLAELLDVPITKAIALDPGALREKESYVKATKELVKDIAKKELAGSAK